MKLWNNGHFHSMHSPNKVFFNILTDNGKIIAVNVDENKFIDINYVDLKGHHVYPGFVDAHLHLVGYGQKLSRIDLSSLLDKNSIIEKLKAAVNITPIVAEGYRDCGLTRLDLDLIVSNQPILLIHNDYHTVTGNSFALAQTNIISANGTVTEKEAENLIETIISYEQSTLIGYFKKALLNLHQSGITGGHSDDLFYFHSLEKTYNAISHVLKEVMFRTHLLIHHRVFDEFLSSKFVNDMNNPYLEFGAVKLFYDGTLSSKTALLSHPYQNSDNYGYRIFPAEEFKNQVNKARLHGYPVAIHVIGDKALDEVADILRLLPPKLNQFDRIIHASLANKSTLTKLSKLPVVFDIQPLFTTTDMPYINQSLTKFPDYLYAWNTYLSYNLKLLGSSDAPVENPNPLLSIHALITRKSTVNSKIYHPKERLDRFTAIKMYTTEHAIVNHTTNSRGYIDIGYLADFTIYPNNLMTITDDDLLRLRPSMTVIDETIVYKQQSN